jgi:branched-subunit amino acid aminotransferase/4-amino-4-deoxychorismate lyase
MIWIRGEIVPDDAPRISVSDRTFEHGLGLFETFRTWDGHPTLLDRHLERMRRSARELGLILDPEDLPPASAVLRLKEATSGAGSGDVRLRIVLSGGCVGAPRGAEVSTVWMTAGPLPPPPRGDGARIARAVLADPDDPLSRHKTLNYWRRRIEQARAEAEGADEVLGATPDGRICEGMRSNVFLVRDGCLITPGADGPLLAGIMRGVVIEQARASEIAVVEGTLGLDAIRRADEAFLTNSLRGMLPLSRVLDVRLPAPGPITGRLWERVLAWLNAGGTTR